MLIAAGIMMAYDERLVYKSSLSGMLQSTSYVTGISGGSWMVMYNAMNGFKPVSDMVNEEFLSLNTPLLQGIPDFDPGYRGPQNSSLVGLKDLENTILDNFLSYFIGTKTNMKPQKNPFINLLSTLFKPTSKSKSNFSEIFDFYRGIHLEVNTKKSGGNHVSFTDYWGRALSRKIFNKQESTKLSKVIDTDSYRKFEQPFPIICSVQKTLGKNESSKNSHLIEITPIEFGSWDSYLNGFSKLKYLGSKIVDGYGQRCSIGYDDIGFLTATSSSLFNSVFLYVYNYLIDVQEEVRVAIQTILLLLGLSSDYKDSSLPKQPPDFAIYSPNPFYQFHQAEDSIRDSTTLYLADGGSDGQNIPFHPLLQPARNVDLILAFDMSSDIWNFPNGSSLEKTAQRYHNKQSLISLVSFQIGNYKLSMFPKVPPIDANTPKRGPLFLGCDPIFDYPIMEIGKALSNKTLKHLPPLIVYTPNQAISTAANTSTFKLHYNNVEIKQMLHNGYNVATRNNSDQFAACIGCAAMKRTYDRSKIFGLRQEELPEICSKCFEEYCWHSTNDLHRT